MPNYAGSKLYRGTWIAKKSKDGGRAPVGLRCRREFLQLPQQNGKSSSTRNALRDSTKSQTFRIQRLRFRVYACQTADRRDASDLAVLLCGAAAAGTKA